MDDLITFQAESVIFYTFGIIIPIITLLYTIGHLVFIIGEFKENNNILPNIILFLVPKLGVLGLALSSILHIVFDKEIDFISDIGFIIIVGMWSFFICGDSYMINSVLRKLDKFNSDDTIDKSGSIKTNIYNIMNLLIKKNKALLFVKYLTIGLYGVFTIINLIFIHKYLSGHSLFIIYLMYIYMNWLMFRYYKFIKTQ